MGRPCLPKPLHHASVSVKERARAVAWPGAFVLGCLAAVPQQIVDLHGIGGMAGATQRLLTIANEQTRIVPGRGPVMSFADLKAQASMYAMIYDRLTTLLNKGRGPGEAVAAKPTKEFDERMGNPDEFVRRSFESLWAYLSPDA